MKLPRVGSCVRDLLALALQLVAVKAVVETASAVTLHVALAIVEVPPTLQGGAALVPGVVEIERTVPAVPAARVTVAGCVAHAVAASLLTLRHLATWLRLF